MKTFEDVKESVKNHQEYCKRVARETLGKENTSDFEKEVANSLLENAENNIEHLEEITTIEIGAETNSLIQAIQTAYKINLNEYWENFENFLDKYVVGITSDGHLKNGAYFGQSQCLKLGISRDDLSCFKGKDPLQNEAADFFRQKINAQFGTTIPMSSEEKKAYDDYNEVVFGSDELAKEKAFVQLKEIQRDSGTLRNGNTYYILSTNEAYKNAKASLSSGKQY